MDEPLKTMKIRQRDGNIYFHIFCLGYVVKNIQQHYPCQLLIRTAPAQTTKTMQHHHILIQKSKQKIIQELMETHGLSVDHFKLVIDNHMVDQICFVYTPSTAELSAA